MARIPALQAGEDGSEPSGVTAGVVERYHAGPISPRRRSNRTPAIPVSPNLAGPLAVNQLIGVRATAPEPR